MLLIGHLSRWMDPALAHAAPTRTLATTRALQGESGALGAR
jgi:hypothetical protein